MSNKNPVAKEVALFLQQNRLDRSKTQRVEIFEFFKKFREEEKKISPQISEAGIQERFAGLFKRSPSWAYQYACVNQVPQHLLQRIIQDGKLLITLLEAAELGRIDPKDQIAQEAFLERALKEGEGLPLNSDPQASTEEEPLESHFEEIKSKDFLSQYRYTREPEDRPSQVKNGYEVRVIKGRQY